MTLPYILIYLVLGIIVLLTLLNFKTSRADGTLIKATHKYRKMMPYLMRGRNESVVYFDDYVDVSVAYINRRESTFEAARALVRAYGKAANSGSTSDTTEAYHLIVASL